MYKPIMMESLSKAFQQNHTLPYQDRMILSSKQMISWKQERTPPTAMKKIFFKHQKTIKTRNSRMVKVALCRLQLSQKRKALNTSKTQITPKKYSNLWQSLHNSSLFLWVDRNIFHSNRRIGSLRIKVFYHQQELNLNEVH